MIDSQPMNPSSTTMIKKLIRKIFEFCTWSDEELEQIINKKAKVKKRMVNRVPSDIELDELIQGESNQNARQ